MTEKSKSRIYVWSQENGVFKCRSKGQTTVEISVEELKPGQWFMVRDFGQGPVSVVRFSFPTALDAGRAAMKVLRSQCWGKCIFRDITVFPSVPREDPR